MAVSENSFLGFKVNFRRLKLSIYILGVAISLWYSISQGSAVTKQQSINESWGMFAPPTVISSKARQRQEQMNYHSKSEPELKQNFSYPFTFAACLQTKDDTLILAEWLAYHYTVLPLRHLIVAIDPLSITTPEPIFERFRSIGMKIDVWTGNWYFVDGTEYKKKLKNFDPKNYTAEHALHMRRQRQFSFYTKCLQELKRNHSNISWVAILDSDEYITYNTVLSMEKSEKNTSIQSENNFQIKLPRTIGKQNETIAHYIADQWRIDGASSMLMQNDTLCTVLPRINFVAKDIREVNNSSSNNNNDAIMFNNTLLRNSTSTSCILPPTARRPNLPKGFDLAQFHTLRFPFHTMNKAVTRVLPGKSFVNIKIYDGREKVVNAHRPFYEGCDNTTAFPDVREKRVRLMNPFRVNHYSGSLETFISRPERTEEMWYAKNKFIDNDEQQSHQYDDSLMDWFTEFVKLVGRNKAYELTQKVREHAHREYMEMKRKYNNTIPPPVFKWD